MQIKNCLVASALILPRIDSLEFSKSKCSYFPNSVNFLHCCKFIFTKIFSLLVGSRIHHNRELRSIIISSAPSRRGCSWPEIFLTRAVRNCNKQFHGIMLAKIYEHKQTEWLMRIHLRRVETGNSLPNNVQLNYCYAKIVASVCVCHNFWIHDGIA